MSDATSFDDLFEAQPPEGAEPKWYRDQLDKAKKAVTAEREAIAAEREALTAERTKMREARLAEFIKDKGLPEKAKALIGDADPQEWFTEYGELFGTAEGSESGESQTPATVERADPAGMSPDQVAALAAVNSVQPGSFTPGDDGEVESKTRQAFENAKSETDLLEALSKIPGALAQ